jgi:hypothetical protein
MAQKTVEDRTVDERRARSKEAGNRTPWSSHRCGAVAADRPDPVALLVDQDITREPDLVPVRQPLQAARRASRPGPAHDAGRQRYPLEGV